MEAEKAVEVEVEVEVESLWLDKEPVQWKVILTTSAS